MVHLLLHSVHLVLDIHAYPRQQRRGDLSWGYIYDTVRYDHICWAYHWWMLQSGFWNNTNYISSWLYELFRHRRKNISAILVDLLLLPLTRGYRGLSFHAFRAQPEPGRDIQAGGDGGDAGTRR